MVERYEFDKIWARRENDATSGVWSVHVLSLATEYIRADINEALAARVAVLEAALFNIAHTFTENSFGDMVTLPATEYQKMARAALSPKQPTPATQVEQIADLAVGSHVACSHDWEKTHEDLCMFVCSKCRLAYNGNVLTDKPEGWTGKYQSRAGGSDG